LKERDILIIEGGTKLELDKSTWLFKSDISIELEEVKSKDDLQKKLDELIEQYKKEIKEW